MTRTGWFILLVAGVIAGIIGVVILLRPTARTSSAESSIPSAEQKAYLPQIAIVSAKMSAARNYLGQTVFYLNAKVVNRGPRPVQRLDVQLEFHDVLDQVVLRDVAHAVRAGAVPLKSGETRAFVIAFEHLPAEWNQAPPVITPKLVAF
jgi:hypothetical protein